MAHMAAVGEAATKSGRVSPSAAGRSAFGATGRELERHRLREMRAALVDTNTVDNMEQVAITLSQRLCEYGAALARRSAEQKLCHEAVSKALQAMMDLANRSLPR